MKRVPQLLVVELRRFAARRMVRMLVLATVLGTALILAFLIARGATIRYPDAVRGTFGSLGMVVILLCTALGASGVAAEWNAGSLAGSLLFEPNRARLLLVRAGAAAIGCAVMAVVVLLTVAGFLALGAVVSGTFEREPELVLADGSVDDWVTTQDGTFVPGPDAQYVDVSGEAPLLRSSVATVSRVAAAAALAGVFGVGAGILVRRTAGVIGAVLLSYAIADMAIAALFDSAYFWGPGRALVAVGTGTPDVFSLVEPSGPYLLFAVLWTVGAMAAAVVWFARAEVATNPR